MDNTLKRKTQVIIVGAGPTGLSLAAQLIRFDIDFIIIDKNESTTPFSKAIVVQARSMEIFQQMGLSKKAIAAGRFTNAMNIFHKGKRKVSINIAGLGNGLSAYPYVLSLEQSKTEKLLNDHINEHEKFVLWNCEFIRTEQNIDGIIAYYKDANGNECAIEAQYIVGCDGAHSQVRHQMGSAFDGDTVPKLFYVTDVILNSPIVNQDELYGFLIKKGFVLFFPMEGIGHYRVIGILTEATDPNAIYTFENSEEFIKQQIISPVNFEKVMWFSIYKVHSRMANSFMNGRSFIAGDAAHIHTPAGGQGMNTGIQDAYNLAWKLAFVLQKKLDANILNTYNTERMANAKRLLRTTDRMFEIMAGLSRTGNFIRLRIFPLVANFVLKRPSLNKRIFPFLSQIGISYSKSKLTIQSSIGTVKSGDRMPYLVFSDGKNIYDYLNGPDFKILFFGNNSNNRSNQLDDLNFQIEKFNFNEIPKNLFGEAVNFYVLLRPDNHISYLGIDITQCEIFFKKLKIT